MLKKKLAIVATHPVQYNAPWFRLLAMEPAIDLKVFYTWSQIQEGSHYDRGFGKVIEWDIPLLEGYHFEFIRNVAKTPGCYHFTGIDNPSLNKDIQSWGAEAILVIGWNYKSHLSAMRHFKGKIPVLFRGDSTLLDEKPGVKKLLRRLFLKYIYSFVDYALYVGSNNRDYFQAHGLKERQLYFVPHAIDNDRFLHDTDAAGKARLWRKELGIAENDFVMLFAGKLEPKKDPDFMLELAAAIENKKARFIIVGNGELEKDLKSRAASDNRVIFIDFQNQRSMPAVYRLADVFILPSKGPGETWGLAINEAMASGIAVMVSKKSGCAIDLVKQNVNGIIMDDNLQNTVNFLEEIIVSRNLSKKMGDASKEIIAPFSFKEIVKKVSFIVTGQHVNHYKS